MSKALLAALLMTAACAANAAWVPVEEYEGATFSIGDKKQAMIGNVVIFWERIEMRKDLLPWDKSLLHVAADCVTLENVTLRSVTYRNGIELRQVDEPTSATVAETGTPMESVIMAACGGDITPHDINRARAL